MEKVRNENIRGAAQVEQLGLKLRKAGLRRRGLDVEYAAGKEEEGLWMCRSKGEHGEG